MNAFAIAVRHISFSLFTVFSVSITSYLHSILGSTSERRDNSEEDSDPHRNVLLHFVVCPEERIACMFLSDGRGVSVNAFLQAFSRRSGVYLSASFKSPVQAPYPCCSTLYPDKRVSMTMFVFEPIFCRPFSGICIRSIACTGSMIRRNMCLYGAVLICSAVKSCMRAVVVSSLKKTSMVDLVMRTSTFC